MQVKIDFIHQEQTARLKGVLVVLERFGDLEQQVAAPGGHRLIPVRQGRQRQDSIGCREHQLPLLAVDALETDIREQLVECAADRREAPGTAPVFQIHRPTVERYKRSVEVEQGGDGASSG